MKSSRRALSARLKPTIHYGAGRQVARHVDGCSAHVQDAIHANDQRSAGRWYADSLKDGGQHGYAHTWRAGRPNRGAGTDPKRSSVRTRTMKPERSYGSAFFVPRIIRQIAWKRRRQIIWKTTAKIVTLRIIWHRILRAILGSTDVGLLPKQPRIPGARRNGQQVRLRLRHAAAPYQLLEAHLVSRITTRRVRIRGRARVLTPCCRTSASSLERGVLSPRSRLVGPTSTARLVVEV